MRGGVVGLPTPYPLSGLLPAYLQEDEFAVRLTDAFDGVLAPAIAVLDCLDAYVDPLLAPDDFIDWLASWVGLDLDAHWEESRRRHSVMAAITLHRARGTIEGLRAQLSLATDAQVEVTETGGTVWALTPGAHDPDDVPYLQIRVTAEDPETVRTAVLEELVEAVKPAHLPHSIEVMSA